ncbi:MAG TPA: serine hydrolase domain-containing protein [Thermodesulfobacteriota bacterium]|nr:serine hydrolase domain-containing protein [Thermodesulfobacteriota bacterium]
MKPQRRVIYFFTVLFLFTTSAAGWGKALEMSQKPEELGFSSERLTLIDKTLQNHIEKGLIPGATILIGRHGKIAYFKTYGFQDKENGDAMKQDTIFRFYSMSKPITAVAAMKMWEEGKFILSDPVSKFIPELKGMKVGVEKKDPQTGASTLELVPCNREMTIQDLLRHTSGMIYESPFFGKSQVQQMWAGAKIWDRNETLAEATAKLSKLPLAFQPGSVWNYSRSSDLLGRVIEVISGRSLDQYLEEGIFRPLGMKDSGFWVKPENQNRVAQPPKNPLTGKPQEMLDAAQPPKFLAGGGGVMGTTMDYARFCQMLLNGGNLDGVRILGPKTVAYMTSDHLGSIPAATGISSLLVPPGKSYGLGFGLRMTPGIVSAAGSAGEYMWGGLAGTAFWVDPKEDIFVVFMLNDMIIGPSGYHSALIRDLVYQALLK